MGTKKSVTYITETATTYTASWTNKQIAQFEYFNPNGTYEKWGKMCDTIRHYVDAGIITTGWLIAYGSLNDYSSNGLSELAKADRVNGTSLYVTLKMLKADIEKGYNALAEELTK